ncbi:hypothetical protein DVH24_024480 [Malus domestica]|uniref:Uncharacterized protein n=1 Tax=Malus domestica TaxID=3750 RepID=A0A498JI88_MALDO|nr:hypothetical protein DVH24_024480 [Malus domestica]
MDDTFTIVAAETMDVVVILGQLLGQLVIQEEQMRAQLRAQGEEMRTYAGMVRDLVQAIQMSGLKISLPAPHLVSPLTSEPPRSADTQ